MGLLIALLVVVTFVRFKAVNAWWWGLRVRTRVLLAVAVVALVGGVGVYYQLG